MVVLHLVYVVVTNLTILKKTHILLIVILLNITLFFCKESEVINNNINRRIGAEEIKKQRVVFDSNLFFPDTTESGTSPLKEISSFTILPGERIAVFDKIQNEIVVESYAKRGETFVFGSAGLGPGEFSGLSVIKYIKDVGLIVNDKANKKCSIFNLNGEFKKRFILPGIASDIDFINNEEIIYTEYFLADDFKPYVLYDYKKEDIVNRFGNITECKPGIMEYLNSSQFHKSYRSEFAYMGMFHISYIKSENSIIVSQKNPYILLKYNLASNKMYNFNISVPYSTYNNKLIIIDSENELGYKKILPSGKALRHKIIKDKIVIPVFNENCSVNYIDCYSINGSFLERLQIPPLGNNISVWEADWGDDGDLFLLVSNENYFYWIQHYSVKL